MSLMPLEHGRYFYHYTKWSTASQDIIPTRKLRLSPYALMRDPLESQAPMLGAGMSYAPGDDDAAEALGQAHLDAQEELGRLRSRSKVLSLTIDADWAAAVPEYDRRFGMGWARARMWEQYADNHTGVVLIFAREPFERVVHAQIQERSPTARAGAVQYTRTGLAGSFGSSIMLTHVEPGSEQARRQPARNFRELLRPGKTCSSTESGSHHHHIDAGRPGNRPCLSQRDADRKRVLRVRARGQQDHRERSSRPFGVVPPGCAAPAPTFGQRPAVVTSPVRARSAQLLRARLRAVTESPAPARYQSFSDESRT